MPRGGLWSNPEFLKLWMGQAVSQMGSRISAQALPLAAVLALGATPLQMGLLNGAGAVAILLFGLFAGAWVDRFRRRPILILADLGRALVLGSIPLAAVLHRLTMSHLYLAAAAGGLLTVFFDSGYQAYVPSLVERENLLEANAKLALTVSISDVAGTGAAGLLVQWITAPLAILFDAVSFLISAFSIWRIRKSEPPAKASANPHMQREILEGLREAWNNPVLRVLTRRTATAAFSAGFIACLYMVFAIRELHLSPALLGGIIAIGGASNLFGALISERLVKRFGITRTLFGSALTAGAASLAVPLAHGSVALCAAILALGQLFDMAWPIYSINELTLRQTVTPDHLLGRVNSAMHLLFYGVMPLGALAGGAIAEFIGMRITMLAGAVGFVLSSLWLARLPAAMRHSDSETGR
jgi:predicted MFS family arabinose efflux permease